MADKRKFLKYMAWVLEIMAVALVFYLVFLPYYPVLVNYLRGREAPATGTEAIKELEDTTAKAQTDLAGLPATEYAVSKNRLIIPKIGVDAPVVEDASETQGLERGAWRLPDSSTPDKGGNTVITGHRFKYLPPNNLTFFLFDRLASGDLFSVIWEGEPYYYRIKETKIIEPTDFSILAPTATSTVTLFTCDPIYSTDHRLVLIGEKID